VFGFGAGVLGGAYGMNGLPLVAYGQLRGWPPSEFRATLQGYFLPASSIAMAGYAASGLWTETVTRYFLISLIPIVIAIFLGRFIHRRLEPERFKVWVHVALLGVGVL